MKKLFLLLLAVLFSFSAVNAQKSTPEFYNVGFYNLENLFDTIHDAGKNDYDFLPEGKNKWGTLKYTNKINNMAMVLAEMGTDVSADGMAVVGVCEVENARVLKDIVEHENLIHRGWRYIHYEGNDKRGVDCALLYNPTLFEPIGSSLVPYRDVRNDTVYQTRGFLLVTGVMGGETVHIIVNHWPSRSAKSPAREGAGTFVRHLKDSLMNAVPGSKVIVMGDLNDNPDNVSVSESLGAVYDKKDTGGAKGLYNPWWKIFYEEDGGTLKYENRWHLFDQIILSGNLLYANASSLVFHKAEIFSRAYMFQEKGRYKGSIKRTHAGGMWLNGYSDHLPVIVYLVKRVK